MPANIVQKILRRASGQDELVPGDIITCAVDLALILDSGGPRRIWPRLKELGVGVWDPEKLIVANDHFVPAVDAESATILQMGRDFAREFGIRHFFDCEGIGHVVLAEKGLLHPGMFACGGDSHSSHGGAYGAYMAGFGAIEMTGVVVTGEIWLQVPDVIRVNWDGEFGAGVAAKDIMLTLCRELGMENAFRVIEFGGSTVRAMPMQERVVLTNMAAELGAETAIIEPDEVTVDSLRTAGAALPDDVLSWQSDADAQYLLTLDFDAATLAPQIAAPHAPSNSGDVGDYAGTPVNQAYIGACVGAKLSDLHMVANVLRGRKVARGTRLLVAPASGQTMATAAADGTLATLTEAGATILGSGCGACAAMGAGILAAGETCISSTNRNFKGRMGSNEAEVYLGSPYSVAAAAVAGVIADPREVLADG